MRVALAAGALYFGVAFAAGFVLGAVRELAVAPALGRTAAVVVEVPVMLALTFVTARLIVRQMQVPGTTAAPLVMGASAFALLMAAEAALSLALGRTLAEHWASYRTAPGLIGLMAQALFALFPLFVARRNAEGRP